METYQVVIPVVLALILICIFARKKGPKKKIDFDKIDAGPEI